MAIFDTGVFMPAESSYTDPIASREALRAEGVKQAAYLSSMDQFYAELEEMKRQFSENLGYREDVLSFEREKFQKTLEWDKAKSERGFELEERKLDIYDRATAADRESDMEKRLALRESRFLQDYYKQAADTSAALTGRVVSSFVKPPQGTPVAAPNARTEVGLDLTQIGKNDPSVYNPFSGQSISSFFNR